MIDPGKDERSHSGVPVVPVFDGFRALAILGIVALHLVILSGVLVGGDSEWYAYLTWGTIGHAVDVLFIVSGFVVFLPTVARHGDFGGLLPYAIRRVARLFPALWLILLISLILIATVNVTPDIDFPGVRDLAFHLTGLQGVAGMITTGGAAVGLGVNPSLWTLSVEVCFYLVLPVFAGIYFRHPLIGLGVAALITVGWNYGFENGADVASFFGVETSGPANLNRLVQSTIQFPSWAFSFGCGMTGAWAFVRVTGDPRYPDWKARIRAAQLVSLAGFVFFAVLASRFTVSAPLNLVAESARLDAHNALGYSAFLAALMVTTALGPAWAKTPFANRPIRQLGDISYGIFLSHMVIAFYLGSLLSLPEDGTVATLLIWTIAVVPLSVLYGYLSARFLEQPVRRWARQFGRRARRPDSP